MLILTCYTVPKRGSSFFWLSAVETALSTCRVCMCHLQNGTDCQHD